MCIHKTHYPPNLLIMNSRTCKFSGLDETETFLSSLIENLFFYLLRICFPISILDPIRIHCANHYTLIQILLCRAIYLHFWKSFAFPLWFHELIRHILKHSIIGGWRKVGDDVLLLSCRKLSSQLTGRVHRAPFSFFFSLLLVLLSTLYPRHLDNIQERRKRWQQRRSSRSIIDFADSGIGWRRRGVRESSPKSGRPFFC
jgi:hypothetical protein